MIKVGVTGGIGSGKTTFCKALEQLGAFVVYADDFAKDLMVSDKELIIKIKKVFGSDSYHEDGSLNRDFLAKEAFSRGRVEELNAIVHPFLWKRVEELSVKKEKEGVTLFVKEAAILLQNGRPENLDYVVLINSNERNRIDWVKKRDGTTEELILDRINKQQDFKEVAHLADYIVENDSDEKALIHKATELHNQLLSKD